MNDGSNEINRSHSLECNHLHRLALEEAQVNREELERLYNESMAGEIRYHFLWRLNQLARICSSLEQSVEQSCQDGDDLIYMRQNIADLVLRAVQLRQEAKLLINSCRTSQVSAKLSGRSRVSVRKTAQNSGRRYPAPSFA